MRRINFGIIGCGVIGRLHAEVLKDLPQAALAAVCDIVPERAEALAEPGVTTAYADLEQMLASPNLEAVCVCTPSGLHAEHAMAALHAGKHALVEKPVDIKLEAVDQLLALQERTGCKLGVISQHRWDEGVLQVKRLLDRGRLGRLAMLNCHTPWYRTQDYYAGDSWRGTWALDGGGALMNQSIHYIDLLRWLGGPVREVGAYAATRTHQIEVEDTAAAALQFANGAVGAIIGTTSAYPGLQTRLEIYGERGSAVLEAGEIVHLRLDGEAEAGMAGKCSLDGACDPADRRALYGGRHRDQLLDFIAALREDREPLVNGLEGRRSLELVLAVYEAARTGRKVKLTPAI